LSSACSRTACFSVDPPQRKLPLLRDKQGEEFSGRILPEESNEEITIYGKPNCWNIEESR
jgi:hypothetical protein